jgi:16S rRNA (guanine527-N7)-methyltransferase
MTDVPAGLEPEPAEASELFGDRIDVGRAFAANLAEFGEPLGLIGPLELPRLWTRHILNSAVTAPLFSGTVGDVGSGAGLPGMVLAIARPDLHLVLIEPMERRVAWLTEQTDELGLDNVDIVRARAEDWDRGRVLDVVTARAVSAFKTLIPLTAPLVRSGGELVLLKGASVAGEIEAARKQIRAFGLSDVRVEFAGEDLVVEPTRVLRATVR